MANLPWETGSFMPWNVGQYFTDANGVSWQVYPDSSSPSGYTLKRTDQAGTSFMTGPTPVDQDAAFMAQYGLTREQARAREATYEAGLATQNQFNNNLQLDTLQVKRDELRDKRDAALAQAQNDQQRNQIQQEYQQGLIRIAEGNLAVAQGDLALRGELGRGDLALRTELGRGDLALRQGGLGFQTAQLGAQLHGPRDIFAYQRAANAVNQNPLLTGAVGAWDSLTSNKPTGMGGWQAGAVPQPFNLGALSSDFGGGGQAGTGSGGGSPYTPEQQAFLNVADQAARDPNKLGSGWWATKNPTQQQMYLGAWESLGHDPATVLSRIQATRIGQQGYGGSMAA